MKKHIIYLTTAMNKNDFKEYLDHWTSPPNPSNQNFHNKMIRALSLGYNVDVISLRPFSNSLVDLKKLEKSELVEDNITWHYLPIHGNKIIRYINCKQNVNKLIKKLYTDESIIFTDTINTSVVRYLSYARKKNNYDIIGLVTDSPSNISNTRRSYTAYLLEANNNYKGYISLTKELDELFNIYGKPSKIIEGIVEKPANISKISTNNPYFFFGGALMERYGIYELIKAFNELCNNYKDIDLYICGHHADNKKLQDIIDKNNRIKYLGILGYDDVLKFEQNSIANINPRPYSEDLDRFSIPSKTLEYMVSGKPTISVKNTKLYKIFGDDIIWAKSSHYLDLKEAMENVLLSTKTVNNQLGANAKKKVLNLYELKSIKEKVKELIDELD